MNKNEYRYADEQYIDRQKIEKYFKRQSRIGGTVYLLGFFIIPIVIGSFLNPHIPTKGWLFLLLVTIGFIAYNGIQMLRTDKAIQKAKEARLKKVWDNGDEQTRRIMKRFCKIPDE